MYIVCFFKSRSNLVRGYITRQWIELVKPIIFIEKARNSVKKSLFERIMLPYLEVKYTNLITIRQRKTKPLIYV